MLVTAPDGTKYTMNILSTVYNSEGGLVESSFYTSRIEDVNGNWINLEYGTLPNRGASQQKYITRITGGRGSIADGREVTFEYIDQADQPINANSLDVRLSKIVNRLAGANDQVWSYTYTEATMTSSIPHMYGLKFYQLSKVARPDGTQWQYTYNPEILATDDSDSLALNAVTYPQGGVVTYDYQQVHFYTWTTAGNLATHSIRTKTTSGSNVTGGTWTYEFLPGIYTVAGHDGKADVTNIYRPDGARETHYHYGHSYSLGYYDLLWAIGLKFRQEIYNANNILLEASTQSWDSRRISAEYYLQKIAGDAGADRATWAPILTSKWVSRYDQDNMGRRVDYSNHDKFGNPQTTTAYTAANSVLYSDKVTQIAYYNNESLWIIGKADTETIDGVAGNIDRTFDTLGRMTGETRYGVATAFTYNNQGDLASTTDALGRKTYFENYYRSIAQLERKPQDNIRVVRVVSSAGTVSSYNITSDADARNLTKSFSFDKLNRLSAIDFRTGADVTVTWTGATKRTLTRGNYQEEAQYDGFGRQIQLIRRDLGAGTSITVKYTYDALGRKIFESFPNSTTKGTITAYTALNDIDRIDYPNGDYRDYVYTGELKVAIVDGRGNTTTMSYNCNGLPEMDRTLLSISTPENVTLFNYNLFNQITSVFQGVDSGGTISGWGREFVYDSRHYLLSESHPEIAYLNTSNDLIVYERDDLGNMIGKTISGTAKIIYGYDNINRLTSINYPASNDVTFTYSKTGKVKTVGNTLSTRTYTHDDNDNLTYEALVIDGKVMHWLMSTTLSMRSVRSPILQGV